MAPILSDRVVGYRRTWAGSKGPGSLLIKQGRLPVSHSERGVTLEKRDVERLSDLNTAK